MFPKSYARLKDDICIWRRAAEPLGPWDAWDAEKEQVGSRSVDVPSGQSAILPSARPSYLWVEMWKKNVDPKEVISRPWMMTKKICSAYVGEPKNLQDLEKTQKSKDW